MVTQPSVHQRGNVALEAARLEWLASGDEALLPIVDAHHHFWDLQRNPHPWLQREPRLPFRYGDYAAICRDFMPADYRAAAGHHRVLGHVLMEGEWDPRDPLGEACWVHALAAAHRAPIALAAQAWLDRDDLGAVLAAYTTPPLSSLVRSVRHKPRSTSRAQYRSGFAEPGSMRCPRWRAGYAQLEDAGLMFELQVPWWHLDEAIELAQDFPRTTLVLNHAGLPAERDAASLAAWRAAIDRLADCDNVVAKISGLGVRGQAWTAELQNPIVDALIESFGTQRCLFASNFPVDGLVVGLNDLFDGFKHLTRHLSPSERLALFCDNAVRVYRLQQLTLTSPLPHHNRRQR